MRDGQTAPKDAKINRNMRKDIKRSKLRQSHRNMTLEGIERRINGNKLGHRRRIALLQAQIETW